MGTAFKFLLVVILLIALCISIPGQGALSQNAQTTVAAGTWTNLNSAIAPSPRRGQAMATTPEGNVLLFGGWNNQNENYTLNDTWLFNATTNSWTQLSTDPTPPARALHVMATTPSGDVLLWGGAASSWGPHLTDTWLFNTATNGWSEITSSPATPPERWGTSMATTAAGVILFGGYNGATRYDDTWRFDETTNTWSELSVSSHPPERYYHAMATTGAGDVLLFGGYLWGSGWFGDTWIFDSVTMNWSQVSTPAPAARYFHAMATTSAGDVLLFGGIDESNAYRNDTWLFNTATNSWSEITSSPATPPERYYHAMAGSLSGILLFGGGNTSDPYLNDTWIFSQPALSLTSPLGGEQWLLGNTYNITWTSIDLTGTVTVEVSYDNGRKWSLLSNTAPVSGSLSWTPDKLSKKVVVRVSGSGYGRAVSATSGMFQLVQHVKPPKP